MNILSIKSIMSNVLMINILLVIQNGTACGVQLVVYSL